MVGFTSLHWDVAELRPQMLFAAPGWPQCQLDGAQRTGTGAEEFISGRRFYRFYRSIDTIDIKFNRYYRY